MKGFHYLLLLILCAQNVLCTEKKDVIVPDELAVLRQFPGGILALMCQYAADTCIGCTDSTQGFFATEHKNLWIERLQLKYPNEAKDDQHFKSSVEHVQRSIDATMADASCVLLVKLYNTHSKTVSTIPWAIKYNAAKVSIVSFPMYPSHIEELKAERKPCDTAPSASLSSDAGAFIARVADHTHHAGGKRVEVCVAESSALQKALVGLMVKAPCCQKAS